MLWIWLVVLHLLCGRTKMCWTYLLSIDFLLSLKNIFDRLLVLSVQQIAFFLSCSPPYTQIILTNNKHSKMVLSDWIGVNFSIFQLLIQNTRQRLFLAEELLLPMPCPFATMSKVMANSRKTVIIFQLYLALHSMCADLQVLRTKWLISLRS